MIHIRILYSWCGVIIPVRLKLIIFDNQKDDCSVFLPENLFCRVYLTFSYSRTWLTFAFVYRCFFLKYCINTKGAHFHITRADETITNLAE
jgi:hypothetical protein